ncbi:MAG TPA: serine/threonine-protein kinase, partial [Polyangiales bacterium]
MKASRSQSQPLDPGIESEDGIIAVEHGDIVGERYRLDRKIGQGGTGSIWLARDLRLERTIAIKFLFARDPEQQERLAKRVALEAKIAASIQHSNVVQIFDYGTHQSNIPYIVMEALSGFTLGAAFDATQSFSIDVVIQIMSDVLRGLATVHHAGIVHRDLKPGNIMITYEDSQLYLLDFGLGKRPALDDRLTEAGISVGTPSYMSPE